MRLNRTLVAILLTSSPFAFGCGEDVGPCDDEARGEDTVSIDGKVQFGGQAIMNNACAGCHSSTATGAARQGAPAGLDFDLLPVDPDDPAFADGTKTIAGQVLVNVKPAALAGLRERRRRVFEDRNTIWQQVKDGMMPPPGGAFDGFRTLSRIIGTDDASPCQADVGAFAPISRKSSRDVLRKWLACSAPVVEVSSDKVQPTPVQENIVTTDAGSAVDAGVSAWSVAGEVGYQFKECAAVGGGDGTQITFEQVFTRVFGKCSLCHPSVNAPDLSTAETAFTSLVDKQSSKCGKPYVVKGNAAGSFLYELVAQTPSCSMRMPPTGNLQTSEIKLIEDWINGGALRESDLGKSRALAPLQSSGLDAGVDD